MTLILQGATASDPSVAGGKGANLARLSAAGFDVPDFFVLPDASFEGPGGDQLSPDAAATLARALATLGPGPYAVRSSGRDEDGADHSHAGQFETVLNVAADDVAQAAAKVRASGHSETVATYRREHGLEGAGQPAVVVQIMVPARCAGIAFSADPVSGLRGRVVVSAISGLGEALVGGEADGEGWTLGDDDVLEGPPSPEVLTAEEALAVAALARAAEAAFGAPQDIEWAFDGDRLRLLQSRNITTGLRAAPIADDTILVLDNSNIIESYPGIVSPLTYTFASYSYDRVYRAFVHLLGLSPSKISTNSTIFANLLTRVDGRVFYNLGNWYRALALLPGFALNRDFMETMMGVSEPLPEDLTAQLAPPPAKGLARMSATAQVAWVGLGLVWEAIRLPRTKQRFMARLNTAMTTGPDPQAASLSDLAATYRRIEAALLDRWDAPLINDFLCMMGFGASRKLLERWAGPAGLTFHNDIMIGQGDIVSAEPAQRIADLGAIARDIPGAADALSEGRGAVQAYPALAQGIDAYLEKFGDRCTQELKLESIPLSTDPAPLLAAISAAARRPPGAGRNRTEPSWTDVMPKAGLRRFVAKRLTNWARARVRDRENLRFERTRIFGHARRVFLAMGAQFHAHGALDDPRDVLLLTVQEVLGAIEGAAPSRDLKAIADLRRAEMAAAAQRPDPPERIVLRRPLVTLTAVAEKPAAPPTGDTRQGTGCSAGSITAPARVIRDPRTESLEPGEILVASNTDPGWIAVFANAAGIVVERGSLLSHSAIVAREMGIPCVVGVGDATSWVTSGEQLRIDGATGEVQKIHD